MTDITINDLLVELNSGQYSEDEQIKRLTAYLEHFKAESSHGKESLQDKIDLTDKEIEVVVPAIDDKKSEKSQELALLNGLREGNWVQKSDALMLLRNVPFTLGELKVLDTYISRINMRNPEKRLVEFTRKEYERLMGQKDSNLQSLRKTLDDLLEKKVKVEINGQFVHLNLFQLSAGVKNEHGELLIMIECTDRAAELFFNLAHYTKYELKYILSLNSQYSYALYLYVKKNYFRGSWTETVDALKKDVFNLDDVETYQQFKYFNDKILKKAVKEVNTTDCHIEYELIKKGRYVVAIKFMYRANTKLDPDEIPGQMNIADYVEMHEEYDPEEAALKAAEEKERFEDEMRKKYGEYLWEYARVTEYIFDVKQIEVLHDLVYKIDPPADTISGDRWTGYYDYLDMMYKRMQIAEDKLRGRGKSIPNKFEYIVKMLENALKEKNSDSNTIYKGGAKSKKAEGYMEGSLKDDLAMIEGQSIKKTKKEIDEMKRKGEL